MDSSTLEVLTTTDTAEKLVLVETSWLRRVIKAHRSLSGLVPHAHCYAIRRGPLERTLRSLEDQSRYHAAPPSLGTGPATQPLLLVARPARDWVRHSPSETQQQIARATLHARVHVRLDALVEQGELDERVVRERIAHIGRSEFETIRATLHQDDLLFPSSSDRDVYIEFAALFLELRFFAPELLAATFPGIEDLNAVSALIEQDLPLDELARCPEVERHGKAVDTDRPLTAPPSIPPPASRKVELPAPSPEQARTWLNGAVRAARRGQHVPSALLASRAALAEDHDVRREAQRLEQAAVHALCRRIAHALGESAPEHPDPSHPLFGALLILVRAARGTSPQRTSPEERVLRRLELAAHAHEAPGYLIDAPGWLLSFGRRPMVRSREDVALLDVARNLQWGLEALSQVSLPRSERAQVTTVLLTIRDHAQDNLRSVLRPKIRGTLDAVALTADTGPELQARDKLIEELLDQILSRGFLTLSHWRDAVSRNLLKLRDLSGLQELRGGDALLRADARFSVALDGIYRRGDLYLRLLQKVSSLPFGTPLGRILTLFVILPAVGSVILLEGTRAIINPMTRWFGMSALPSFPLEVFVPPALLVLLLLHSETSRQLARMALDVFGWLLGTLLWRIPRAILSSFVVRGLLARPAVRVLLRRIVVPAGFGALVYGIGRLGVRQEGLLVALSVTTSFAFSILMGTNLGWRFEVMVFELLAPTWRTFSRHWIPALLRSIGRAFAVLLDGFERILHWVGDSLRFRSSKNWLTVAVAGVLGVAWAVVAYVARLYITLLIEPEVNPIKHFPVVTVAHKLTLPFTPDLLELLEKPFSIFGPIVGGALVGLTVFLFPSVFGFLAWELNANYRLYRKTRPPYVTSTRFGPAGETLRELLVPGIHSGTLPKVYAQRRRQAHRLAEQQMRKRSGGAGPFTKARFSQRLEEIRRSVARFVERELFPPLEMARHWTFRPLRLSHVRITPNRIRITFAPENSSAPAELVFEQVGGYIIASLNKLGFLGDLDPTQARIFENALAVFYHRAGVDLVREQLDAELGPDRTYEVTPEGLVCWPASKRGRLVFPLDGDWRKKLRPKLRGTRSNERFVLPSERILYARQRIRWTDWEAAWSRANRSSEPSPRLLRAGTLLP